MGVGERGGGEIWSNDHQVVPHRVRSQCVLTFPCSALSYLFHKLLPDLKSLLTGVVPGWSEWLGCTSLRPTCHPGEQLPFQLQVSDWWLILYFLKFPSLIIIFLGLLQFPAGSFSLMLAVLELAAFRQNTLFYWDFSEIPLWFPPYNFYTPLPLVFIRCSQ